MAKKIVESKLRKIGIPASTAAIAALIVEILCNNFGACSQLGGTLFTTNDGSIITGLTAGVLQLDFTSGKITTPNGTIYDMNTSLQTMSLQKCNSFMIYCSDADSVINVGNALTIADHQLTHVIHNYAFDHIQITIPANSTPDENQVAFMASEDQYLNYEPHDYWHDRGTVTGTSTDTLTNYYTKHVGAYDDFYITTYNKNTGGSGNSIDVKIYFSEDGVTFFAEQSYTTAVTITAGSYDAFASSRKHHFYRVEINATSAGNQNDFEIYYNNVSVFQLSFNGDQYATGGASVVMTTAGDLVRYNTARERLGVGSANQVLQVSGGLPTWQTLSTAGSTLTTQGDILYHDAAGLQRLAAGTSGDTLQTQGAGANPIWAASAGGGKMELIMSHTVPSSMGSFTLTFPSAVTMNTVSKVVGVINMEKSSTAATIFMKYNGVGTSTYSNFVVVRNSSSLGGYANSSRFYGWDLFEVNNTNYMFGTFELQATASYGNMIMTKELTGDGGYCGGSGWNTTTGVTTLSSLYFEANTGNIVSGSTIDLYKVNL